MSVVPIAGECLVTLGSNYLAHQFNRVTMLHGRIFHIIIPAVKTTQEKISIWIVWNHVFFFFLFLQTFHFPLTPYSLPPFLSRGVVFRSPYHTGPPTRTWEGATPTCHPPGWRHYTVRRCCGDPPPVNWCILFCREYVTASNHNQWLFYSLPTYWSSKHMVSKWCTCKAG